MNFPGTNNTFQKKQMKSKLQKKVVNELQFLKAGSQMADNLKIDGPDEHLGQATVTQGSISQDQTEEHIQEAKNHHGSDLISSVVKNVKNIQCCF